MKGWMIEAALIVALIFAAAGAAVAAEKQRQASSMLSPISMAMPALWRDPDNGCEYLVLANGSNGIAITPRMQADGRQICRR